MINLMRKLTLFFVFLAAATAVQAQRKVVQPKEFATGRPFSPGVWAGDTLFVAGQTGSDPKTGKMSDNFEEEVKQTLDNIGIILKEAGLSYDDVVTVNVYLTDMSMFARMNAVYTKVFTDPRPARTTVGVPALAGNAHVEITVTAHSSKRKK